VRTVDVDPETVPAARAEVEESGIFGYGTSQSETLSEFLREFVDTQDHIDFPARMARMSSSTP
jgi:hypothetical protein